jgi:hypothetical protein
VLEFNAKDELVNFYSDDRYQSTDGKVFRRYRWSTPLSDYRDFGGRYLAARGDGVWDMPAGKLVYGRFELLELQSDTPGGGS